jgi:hypothetical protein
MKVFAETVQRGIQFSSRFALKDDNVRKIPCVWALLKTELVLSEIIAAFKCRPAVGRFTKISSTAPLNRNNSNVDPRAAFILGTVRRSSLSQVTDLPRGACGPACILTHFKSYRSLPAHAAIAYRSAGTMSKLRGSRSNSKTRSADVLHETVYFISPLSGGKTKELGLHAQNIFRTGWPSFILNV